MESIKPIVKQEELDRICHEIDQLGRFALDLEFIPEKTYNPVLALLQIATDKGIYIIDPLANVQLMEFWKKVADPKIVKILHAAKEDLNIIRQLSGLVPKNIFDTQVAAGFLGQGFPAGYKKLLAQVLDIQINKSESFTDWLVRPLSEMQLQYAFEDVCHMLALADTLSESLKEKNRLTWVLDECASFFTEEARQGTDYSFTRIKGARVLSRHKLAVLQALCVFRTEEAKRINKPLRSILSDMTLLELSKKTPRKVEAFDEMRGINIDQARRHGKKIITIIEEALNLPQQDWPIWPAMDVVPDTEALVGDVLYALLKVESYQLEIAAELLATRNEVQRLITYFRRDGGEQQDLSLLTGWRHELIGEQLLNILRGTPLQINVDIRDPAPVKVSF